LREEKERENDYPKNGRTGTLIRKFAGAYVQGMHGRLHKNL
jgi:hypothetical protein